MDLLFILAGLVFLFLGGEALVRGASMLAYRLGLSPLIIGLVVVGFGTSTPELLVSVQAALEGAPDIAVGNVVGSNIANLLLIGGIAALLAPFPAKGHFPLHDLLAMLLAAIAVIALAWLGTVDRTAGLVMLAILVGYLAYTYWQSRKGSQGETDYAPPAKGARGALSTLLSIVFVVVGIAALMQGASLLVHGATSLARDWGVSEAVIGLTIVAVGTSLPELATTIVAAMRRNSAIAIGNIIGSNIFNIFAILAVTALIQPLVMTPQIAVLDGPLLFAISAAAVLLLWQGRKIGRFVGLLCLASYGAYLAVLFV